MLQKITLVANLTVILLSASSAYGQEKLSAKEKIDQFTMEAKNETNIELYNHITEFNDSSRLKIKSGTKIIEVWSSDETIRNGARAQELEHRAPKDPEAALYFGITNMEYCFGMKSIGVDASKCFNESLQSFKYSSSNNYPKATFNAAYMIQNGLGVNASNYVAAEWYTKAANQYLRINNKDEALSSLESAIKSVENYPEAIKLRNQLFKTKSSRR